MEAAAQDGGRSALNPWPLVERRALDPRPAADASAQPIDDAVNIPLEELPARTLELPPRGEPVEVAAAPALAAQTVRALETLGRRAVVRREVRLGERSSGARGVGRLWRPTPSLDAQISRIEEALGDTRREALDVACGTGRDAVYLAARGWRVTAIDVLPDALEKARSLERRYVVGGAPIEWRCADLEGDAAPPGDLVQRFDLITVFRYLHRPLFPALLAWLRDGGVLLYETFTTRQRDHYGKPTSDRHLLRAGELRVLLAPLAIEHYDESHGPSGYVARALARKTAPSHGG